MLLLGLPRCGAAAAARAVRHAFVAEMAPPTAGVAVYAAAEGPIHDDGRVFYAVHCA